ncbi:MAG: N-acetylmuramoyl-L-alanine amidase [Clostridia bacterium]|nr:N-acetylmuramoyl-L-alanine amidase [Clostridia bacterium]
MSKKIQLNKSGKILVTLVSLALVIGIICFFVFVVFGVKPKPLIDKQIIAKSEYTYTGDKNNGIKYIVIHYVANPGSSAQANRNYFNNLATTHERRASAHFVIGLDGEIIQCVPLDMAPYANGNDYYNMNSISIECCHEDSTGKFNEKTIESLKKLVLWLCQKYGLTYESVIRHYDTSGKMCPIFYVQNENEWIDLKQYIFN